MYLYSRIYPLWGTCKEKTALTATAIAITFSALALAEALYLYVARKAGIAAGVEARSSHRRPVVSGGGVVFYFAMAAWWIWSGGADPSFFLGCSLVAFISFVDDVHPLSVEARLLIQFLGVIVAFAGCPYAATLSPPAVGAAILFGVGFINGWNFMDGINGMCAGYTLLTLCTLLVIDLGCYSTFVDPGLLECGIMAAAVLAWCNFRRRALCFAGDVGSLTSAFIVLYALSRLMISTGSIMWLGLVAVYGVDVTLTIVHRIILQQNIFRPHRMHLYELLANEGGHSHLRISACYIAMQAAINTGLYLWPGNPYIYLGAVLAILSAIYIAAVRRLHKG